MLEQAITYTTQSLNQFLTNKFGLQEKVAISNTIVDANGAVPLANQNKLVLTLINIEKDANKQFYQTKKQLNDGSYARGSTEERYNLYIMLSANFDDYKESLKFLNAGILFFQTYSTIDAKRFSSIPDGIDKLELEMENISFHDMHSLWNAIGAKYQPSAIYQLRLITVTSDQMTALVAPIETIETESVRNDL